MSELTNISRIGRRLADSDIAFHASGWLRNLLICDILREASKTDIQ